MLISMKSCPRGSARENLDYLEVVHVFLRRSDSSGRALHQAGQTRQTDHPAAWLSNQEFSEGLVQRVPAEARLASGLCGAASQVLEGTEGGSDRAYLTHDRCIAATMRSLGYPCRGTLTAWVREALPDAGRPVVGSTGRRRHSGELMQAGVMALCTREESGQAIADKFGVCRPTLYIYGLPV